MSKDNYIILYEDTYKKHRPKPVELIKNMLIAYKEKHMDSTKAINEIKFHFSELENNNITNSAELKYLYDIYLNARPGYENGHHLLAIPNELYKAYKQIQKPSISFKKYVECLAIRECTSKIIRDFSNKRELYEAMYIIGRFEGFKKLKEFDIVDSQIRNYFEIYDEIRQLAYPSNITIIDENPEPEILKKVNPFKFKKEIIEIVKSENVYNILEEEFFDGHTTNYEDYLNAFFEDVTNLKSSIKLNCDTRYFSLFLSMIKEEITTKVSYTEIEKYKLFETKHSNKILSRDNISSSKRNPTKKEKETMQSFINLTFKS